MPAERFSPVTIEAMLLATLEMVAVKDKGAGLEDCGPSMMHFRSAGIGFYGPIGSRLARARDKAGRDY